MNRTEHLLSALLLVVAALSCQKTDVTVDNCMTFSADETKATLASTHNSFKVWATRVADANTTLMDGYRVNLEEAQWTYTEGTGTDSQSLRYWDTGATSFRFHAGAPYSAVSDISEDCLKLSLSPTSSINNTALFTTSKEISTSSSEYGKTVGLKFNQAYARIQMEMCLATKQDDAGGNKTVYDIAMFPTSPDTFPTSAEMTVDYDWNTGSYSTSLNELTQSNVKQKISFGTLAFTPAQSGLQSNGKYHYKTPQVHTWYMVPTNNPSAKWSISLKIDGIERSNSIPFKNEKSQCQWEAGKSYKYQVMVYNDFIMINEVSVEPWEDLEINIEVEGE